MVFFKFGSTALKQNKAFPVLLFLVIAVLAGSCVHSRTVEETLMESGFDRQGRPIAFQVLPKSNTGDVDWVEAIKNGLLQPKASLDPSPKELDTVLDLDILFQIGNGYPLPNVIFPHAPHTMWLNCNNCHPVIFSMKQGANPVSMDRIIKGEFCGRCHGKVAFPISDCLRCHSSPKEGAPSTGSRG